MSALHRALSETFNELPLRGEEEQYAWQYRHQARSHQQIDVVDAAELIAERVQRDRERRLLVRMQVDERCEKIVPHVNEREDGADGGDWSAQRQRNAPPDAKPSVAVDRRGLDERFRDLGNELAIHEYEERAAE